MIFTYRGMSPKLDATVYIAPGAQLIGDVTIGKESSIWFNAVLRADNASIRIGDRTNVQEGCTLHVDEGMPLQIGNDVTVGHNVILHGCSIKDGALIGMGSILLNGAEIGEEALIAAGTLIPQGKKIPPRTLVMGNPGKVVRDLTDQDIERIKSGAKHYVEKSREYMTLAID